MRTVTHREMRNSSGEILRAVAAGEDVLVTNNGEPAALITRPNPDAFEALKTSGQVRLATSDRSTLASLTPRRSAVGTAELLDELRGDR